MGFHHRLMGIFFITHPFAASVRDEFQGSRYNLCDKACQIGAIGPGNRTFFLHFSGSRMNPAPPAHARAGFAAELQALALPHLVLRIFYQ
jgi:uncharacterized protein YbjT (DUF2867 family)